MSHAVFCFPNISLVSFKFPEPLLFSPSQTGRGTMASADFCRFNRYIAARVAVSNSSPPLIDRSPRVRSITFIPSTRCIYCLSFGQYRLHFVLQTRPSQNSLLCSFYSSSRDFASSFFQIPPRGGHPCCQLIVPAASLWWTFTSKLSLMPSTQKEGCFDIEAPFTNNI